MAKVIEQVKMLVTLRTEEGVFSKGKVFKGDTIPKSILNEIRRGTRAVRVMYDAGTVQQEPQREEDIPQQQNLVIADTPIESPSSVGEKRENVARVQRSKAIAAKKQKIGK